MVELKSGDTYNGVLENVDKFMNIKIKDVILASKVNKNEANKLSQHWISDPFKPALNISRTWDGVQRVEQ